MGEQEKREKELSFADKVYQPEDYQQKDQTSAGFAKTHEQVSDTLTEGTIDAKIEHENGESEEIPRKGFE